MISKVNDRFFGREADAAGVTGRRGSHFVDDDQVAVFCDAGKIYFHHFSQAAAQDLYSAAGGLNFSRAGIAFLSQHGPADARQRQQIFGQGGHAGHSTGHHPVIAFAVVVIQSQFFGAGLQHFDLFQS